jgi:flagellar hook-length control protein FliK
MSLSLTQALPGTLPLPSGAATQALLPAAPGTPAPGTPAGAGFVLALQQTAQPALWATLPLQAGSAPAVPVPPLALPVPVAELPAGDGLADAPDEQAPSADLPAAALLAPLFAPIASTPAFQPHGLALLSAATSPDVAATTSSASAAPLSPPSAPAAALALPVTALATAQDTLPTFSAALLQASAAPQAPSPQPAAVPQVPATTATPTEAVAAPLEKALAAATTASREAPTAAWAPAPADGLAASLPSTPAAAPSARAEGSTATDLVEALGERIHWQIRRGTERAQIRLDPPMQGQLEISVRRDGAGLQIHLSATHSDVVRQLQAISDSLRGDLATRQTGDVTVTIAQHAPREHDGRGRQARDHAPDAQGPGQALAEAERGQVPQAFEPMTFPG